MNYEKINILHKTKVGIMIICKFFKKQHQHIKVNDYIGDDINGKKNDSNDVI